MVEFRTYESADLEPYLAYFTEATSDFADAIGVEGPSALDRVLLKPPSYSKEGHFLAQEDGRIVADAVALAEVAGGQTAGFLAWNAVPDARKEAVFEGLLQRCLDFLAPKTRDVRMLLRKEHAAAARGPLEARGLSPAGALAELSGPTSRSRSQRAIRALRPADVEATGPILTQTLDENPIYRLAAIEGPFGMSVCRDSASGVYFAADRDDRPVGIAGVGVRGGEGVIDFVAVHSDYRRTGIGSSLLVTALFWLSQRDCGRAIAVVDPADVVAGEFYRRFGFSSTDRVCRIVYRTVVEGGAAST